MKNYIVRKNSMLKWRNHVCSEFSEQLDIIDCIDKYFLKEKMAFLWMPNFCFHEGHIYWYDIFSVSSQAISLTMITFQ